MWHFQHGQGCNRNERIDMSRWTIIDLHAVVDILHSEVKVDAIATAVAHPE